MKKLLKPRDVVYDFNFENNKDIDDKTVPPQYREVYNEIRTSLLLKNYGYNMYLIDEFSKEREKHIIDYIKDVLKDLDPPSDICYVVREDVKEPIPLRVGNGFGIKLQKALNEVQDAFAELIFTFYTSEDNKEKEQLIDSIKEKRSKIVEELVTKSRDYGFDIKVSDDGFTFVPLVEGKEMTEEEYDNLCEDDRQELLSKVSELKVSANKILDRLKDISDDEIGRIKEILEIYLNEGMKEKTAKIHGEFSEDEASLEYLTFVCTEILGGLVNNYTINYDDDAEKIKEIIYKYSINIIVDNSKNQSPPVIFEEDPSVSNLLGSIEYENHNNMYISTVESIRAGSYLRGNGGCLIIRAKSLFENSQSYYYLKKSLISGKVNLDYNRGYLELFTLGGLKPKPVEIDTKVILIGDFEIYNILYNNDKDFKNIFRIKAQCRQYLYRSVNVEKELCKYINVFVKKNNTKPITQSGIKAVAKYLSRRADDNKKFYFDYDTIEHLILLSNYNASISGKDYIDDCEIESIVYKKEIIEDEYSKYYADNKILLEINGSRIGQINGLSVIDVGFASFGKPTRITCTCWKGDGKIIDTQRESSMSGSIHTKGISILKGYVNNLNGGIKKLPVDFNLSFEQLYGMVDGDSASAAEIIVIISALCKIPIKQGIAITGSVNQFGEMQAIGGVNEKIEGFYNVCRLKGSVSGKGVIIPERNVSNLILSREVEEAVIQGDFSIYAIDNVEDAMEIMFDMEEPTREKISEIISRQFEIYKDTDDGGKKE